MSVNPKQDFVTVPGRIAGLPVGLRNRAALKGKVPVPAAVEEQDNSDASANDNLDFKSLTSGTELSDGSVFVGEADGAYWATTPKMHPRVANHRDALQLAKDLNAHGHKDWELPNRTVSKKLYEVRSAGKLKGTFNKSEFKGDYQAIWTSEVRAGDSDYAWSQWFDDGGQNYGRRSHELSVRPVRRLPVPKP